MLSLDNSIIQAQERCCYHAKHIQNNFVNKNYIDNTVTARRWCVINAHPHLRWGWLSIILSVFEMTNNSRLPPPLSEDAAVVSCIR